MQKGGSGDALAFVASSSVRARIIAVLSGIPRTPTEVARLENKHVSHVSRAIHELEHRGLVEFVNSESRRRYYRTTSQGMALALILARGIR